MDTAEAKDRKEIIREGLDRFLDENELDLSKQKITKIVDRLFFFYSDTTSISISGVHNYLQENFDYNEFNRLAQNNASTPESAAAVLNNMLLAVDNKKTNPMKSLVIVFLIISAFLALFVVFSYSTAPPENTTITILQANELKGLVKKIIKIEKENGNKTTYASVWNSVKKSEAISKHGYKRSYKEFSYVQYEAAKKYLEEWAAKAKISNTYSDKGDTIELVLSEIQVSDGDTFKTPDAKYRLWGVDAFELKQKCYDVDKKPYPCGQYAKKELESIFSNAKKVVCDKATVDRYKRIVAKCYVDGVELGELLIRSGWVIDYTKYSGGHFKISEEQAKNSKVGAWAGCFVLPWDYRHKENLDVCPK